MRCNYKKQLFIILLFSFVVTTTVGRGGRGGSGRSSSRGSSSRGSSSRGSSGSGGGFFSNLFGKSSSSSGTSSTSHTSSNHGSYPKQTYSTGTSGTSTNQGSYPKQTYSTGTGNTNTNYGWKTNTGGNQYNSNSGHYYNSPSSTNWGSSYSSPTYNHQPQNAFGTFHPVSSGIAPSYHFHRSTSYVPIYIPSSHTYIHRHYTNNDHSATSTTTNNNPPPPPSEPVVYKDESSSGNAESPMIVGFNNMIVYGVYESDKHYVITVSEDLDEDIGDIPEKFLQIEDSQLFEIVTMKPATTTTTTTSEPFTTSEASAASEFTTTDDWTTNWTNNESAAKEWVKFLTTNDKERTATNFFQSIDAKDGKPTSAGSNVDNDDDEILNLYFGDIILR